MSAILPPATPPEPQIKDTSPNPQQALAGFFGKMQTTPTDLPGAGSAEKDGDGGTTKADGPPTASVAQATTPTTPKPLEQSTSINLVSPDDDESWPKDSNDWKLRKANQARKIAERDAAIATLKKEKAEIETKLKTLPADDPEKPILKSQIEELRTQVKQFSDQLYSVARERHPEFVAKYDKKIDSALKLAEAVAGPKIAQLLKLPEGDYRDEKLQEVFDGLSEMKRARLGPILNEIDLLQSQRASELSVSQEEFQVMVKKHELETRDAELRKNQDEINRAESMWNTTLAQRPTLKPKEGDEAFNAALQKRINQARDVMFGRAKPEEVINTMLNAAEYEALKPETESLREEVRQLQEQLKAVQGATPRLGEPSPNKGDTNVPLTSGMSPRQAMTAFIQKTLKAGT